MKKHIITFCDTNNWESRIDYFIQEAINTQVFDNIKVYTNDTLDEEFKNIIGKRFEDIEVDNHRGYAYWSWKSHIIKDYMNNNMEEGDVLMFLDAGCTLNNSENAVNKLKNIIDDISESDSKYITSISLQKIEHSISNYTKPSLIKKFQELYHLSDSYIGMLKNKICFEAGFIIVKKCQKGITFINAFDSLVNQHYDYITDKILCDEDIYFIENGKHRHDQSAFSLLCNLYNIQPCMNYFDNCWSNKNDYNDYYENFKDEPVWYTRTKTHIPEYVENKAVSIIYGNNELYNKIQSLNILRDINHYEAINPTSLEDIIEAWKVKCKCIYDTFIKLEDNTSLIFIDENISINNDAVEDGIKFFINLTNDFDRIFFFDDTIKNHEITKKSTVLDLINFLQSSYGYSETIYGDGFGADVNSFSFFVIKKTKENVALVKDILFITNILTDHLRYNKVWDTDLEWVNTNKVSMNTNNAFSIITRYYNNIEINLKDSCIKINT